LAAQLAAAKGWSSAGDSAAQWVAQMALKTAAVTERRSAARLVGWSADRSAARTVAP
jgi:hypothetical protein